MAQRFDLEYDKLKNLAGFRKKVPCSPELQDHYRSLLASGTPLPPDVQMNFTTENGVYKPSFYTMEDDNGEDFKKHVEFLLLSQIQKMDEQEKTLSRIKNYLTFFVILAVVSIVIGFIYGLVIGASFR